MFFSGSGSGTTTVVNPNPPQLLPEAKEGFNQAQNFYKSILGAPPQYGGPRLANVTPGQKAGINEAYDYFGQPQPYQLANEDQVAGTAQGQYLGGPQAQAAMQSLADPIFARFRDETMPQIRDRAQFAGTGITSARRGIATTNAVDELGRQLATSAFAPIYNQERDRQMQAAGMSPNLLTSEALRLGQLSGAGAQERGFSQEQLDAQRQAFEEPIFRQGQAASSLLSAAGYGPGASTSTSNTTTNTSAGDAILGLGTTALLAYALFSGFGNTK